MRWRLLKLDLPYLIGELVIVVIGVGIALTAERWRQDYQDSLLEADYIARLQSDIRSGESLLNRRDTQLKTAAAANLELLEMLSGSPENQDANTLATTFSIASRIGFTSADIAHDVTYQELRDSGRLSLLSNTSLRESLAEYYRRIAILSSVWEDIPTDLVNRVMRLTRTYPNMLFDMDDSNRSTLTAEMTRIINNDLIANRQDIIDELDMAQANIALIQNRMDNARSANAEIQALLAQQ